MLNWGLRNQRMDVRDIEFHGKCAKQTTIAIIENDGDYFIGTNWCHNPQTECPRGDMGSGKGYDLCEVICEQEGHAEINAIKTANGNTKGGTMFLIGHYYMCDDCKKACEEAGIENVFILDDVICKERIQ